MPRCYSCSRHLPGNAWKVDDLGDTGGRLGINGYFLSKREANWMDAYCRSCWEEAVFDLSFVEKRIASLQTQLTSSEEERKKTETRKSELEEQLTTLQTENTSLQQELNKFNTADVQNLKNLLEQLDKQQLGMLRNTGEFSIEEFHCKQITEQQIVAKELVKEAIEKLKIAVEKCIQHQTYTLAQRETGVEKCIEVMTSTEMPAEVMDSNLVVLRKHVQEENDNLGKWKKFKSDLEEEKKDSL